MKFIDKLNYNNETYEIRDTSARDILTEQGEQLAETSATVQGHGREINNLKTRMNNAETAILENTADISEIEDAIDDIDTDISNIRADITEINGTLDTHASDISDIQSDISDIKSDITDINGDITVINGNITTINESIDALATVNAQQSAAINRNTQDITQLKQRATTAESRLDGIDNRLDGIDDDIEDLNDRIVASTYEAGEGIYFGQGEEHTNINVEDELLDEIHGNTQAIEDLGDRVDTLEERVDDIADDVTDLKSDVTQIQGDITTIQGNITTIQGDITNIQGDITQISGDITTIQGDITTIQNAITLNEEDIAKLKNSAKCNIITVEYTSVGGVETYDCHTSAADIAEFIREYKANSAGAQGTYIDHKDIIVNVSQGPYSYPDNVGIINNYSKPIFIYTTAVDTIITFINNADWNDYNNDSYELVSLILHSDNTIEFQTYNWNSKLYPIQQAVQGMAAQVQANTNALDTLAPQVSQNTTNITNLQTSVAALDTDVYNIQGDITTIQGDITNIQGDITQLQGDMTTAQSDITSAQTDITGLRSDVTALQGDMTTAQGDITQLQSDVTDIDKRTHVHKIPLVITSTGDPPTFTSSITVNQFEEIISDYNSNGGQIIAVITDGTSSLNPPYEGNCNLISIEGYNTGDNSGIVGEHYMIFETCNNDHYSQKYYITLFTQIVQGSGKIMKIDVKTVDPFADIVNVTSATDLARLYNIVTATDFSTMKQYSHIPLIYFNTGIIWQDTMGIIERNGTTVKITYKRGETISQYGLEQYQLTQITMTGASTYTTNTINLSSDASVIKYYQELCGISRNVTGTTKDLNSIIEPGRWNVDTSASTTNSGFPADVDPTQINHWTLENTSSVVTFGFISNYTTITQTLTIKDNPGVMYRRARNNNAWGTWYKFTGTAVT